MKLVHLALLALILAAASLPAAEAQRTCTPRGQNGLAGAWACVEADENGFHSVEADAWARQPDACLRMPHDAPEPVASVGDVGFC